MHHEEIERLTFREIAERINVAAFAESFDEKSGESHQKLQTVAMVYRETGRADALYLLAGAYFLCDEDLEAKERVIKSLSYGTGYRLYRLILKDLSRYKNLYRRKFLVEKMIELLPDYPGDLTEEQKREIEEIVENAAWGRKMKEKFLGALYPREDEDFLFF